MVRASPGGVGTYWGAAALAATTDFEQSQDTLYTLASDTGGKALFDFNDLTKGIVQAESGETSYYLLGYYTTNAKRDGKFRRIKISLRPGLEGRLDCRRGYYANKVFKKSPRRPLARALRLPGDPT